MTQCRGKSDGPQGPDLGPAPEDTQMGMPKNGLEVGGWDFRGIPKWFVGQVVFWRPGVPRPNKTTPFQENNGFGALPPKAARPKNQSCPENRGLNRPLLPHNPLEKVGGVAPHLFQWVLR